MAKKDISLKDDSILWQETIDTPETEIVEENFFIDENFLKNKSLIRMDMNIIQYPIFSKNTKRKVNQIVKYYFNSNRDTHITVTPAAGDYIPGEGEEKIFIALMQIMKEKGLPKKFTISSVELREKLKIKSTRSAEIIKNSLMRLSQTNYIFKNTMYSSEKKGVIKEQISTPILTLRILTLSLAENKFYRNAYNDKRIKEIYEITISDHFYKNIIQKGYMVYNGNTLLEIDLSTARTIYMMIEKLRFYEVYLRLDTIFLIKRIPLKYDKKNLNSTIKTLEKAFGELKEKNLIKDFNFIKESTWEKSEIEIFFHENSIDNKLERFFGDRNDFKRISTNLTISAMEHALMEDEKVEDILSPSIIITKDIIENMYKLLPEKAKKLKTMKKTLAENLQSNGVEKVEAAIRYMNKQKSITSPRALFLKILENNWAEEELLEIRKETDKKPKKKPLVKSEGNKKIDSDIFIENSMDIVDVIKDVTDLDKIKKVLDEDKIIYEKVKKEVENYYLKEIGSDILDQRSKNFVKKTFNSLLKNVLMKKEIFSLEDFEIYYGSIDKKPEIKVVREKNIFKLDSIKDSDNDKTKEEVIKSSTDIEFKQKANAFIDEMLSFISGSFGKTEFIRTKVEITKRIIMKKADTLEKVQEIIEEVLLEL